jgi:lipid II:glycine glycyltransferase (peptidoglycan interpeptide bridge formation enzyme)
MPGEILNVVHEPTELDEDAWRNFLLANDEGNIFQTPEMYKVYLATDRYEPVLTAITRETGQIMALTLGFLIEERRGIIARRFSRRIVIMGVPAINNEGNREDLLGRVLSAHNEIARKKAVYTEIRPMNPVEQISPQFGLAGYSYESHLNMLIDLTLGQEDLWSRLRPKKRQAIRKGIKLGLTTEVLTLSDIDELYPLLEKTYERARIPMPPKSLFRSVFTLLPNRNFARVVGVRYQSKLIAAVVSLLYKDTIYAWFSAVDRRYSRQHGVEMAFWSIIEWGAENGFELFDFGGAGRAGKKYGVRDFKKRMGGQQVESGRLVCRHSRLKAMIASTGLKGWRAIQWAKQRTSKTKTEDTASRKDSTTSPQNGGKRKESESATT